MIDERNDFHPATRNAFLLLDKFATAATRIEAIKIEYSAREILWELESSKKLSRVDVDKLGIVFRMALEKRLHELAFL